MARGLSSAWSLATRAAFRQVWCEPGLDGPSWLRKSCGGGLGCWEQLGFRIKRNIDTLVSGRVWKTLNLLRPLLAVQASGLVLPVEAVLVTFQGVGTWAGVCVGAGGPGSG